MKSFATILLAVTALMTIAVEGSTTRHLVSLSQLGSSFDAKPFG